MSSQCKGDSTTNNFSDLGGAPSTIQTVVMLGDSGTGGEKGAVPAPGAGDAGKFLRGDATWQAVSGAGTVTSVSSGNLSPLFTASVATPTSTPALSFSLSTATAHAFLGNNTASTAAPTYVQPAFTDLNGTAATGQIPNLDSSKITTGALALARGGTGVDLSASGGATFVLAQAANQVISARALIAADIPAIAESGVTNLVSDLALKSPLASPTFTGIPAAPSAAVSTNTTQLATTAFVVGQAATVNPVMDGAVAIGTSLTFARQDHVHPSDTSRAPLASPTLTGTPAAPTAAVSTNTTQLATTAFVLGQVGTATPIIDGTAAVGTSLLYARQDHVHPTDTTRAATAGPTFTGVPVAPTAAAGTNTTQLATTAFATAINNNSSYRILMEASGSHTAAVVAGTYAMANGNPLAVTGVGTLFPLAVFQIVGADYPTINGITTKLRIRAQLYTNDVAPTGNFTFGLYPITRPATSGGAGVCIFTLGTVVAGSNGATFTTPAADLLGSAVGADFALPADGPYVIGVVTTATVAASAHVHLIAQLQMRNT